MKKILNIFLLVLILVQSSIVFLGANSVDDVNGKIKQKEEDIKTIESELTRTQSEYQSIIDESKTIDKEIKDVENKVDVISSEMTKIKSEIPLIEDRAEETLKVLQKIIILIMLWKLLIAPKKVLLIKSNHQWLQMNLPEYRIVHLIN